ncbi:LPXTG cell wall anchor domain-containing protein [Enterococcus sp. LJL120]
MTGGTTTSTTRSLPQTGEADSWFTLIVGISLLGVAGLLTFKRRKFFHK